MSAAQEVVATTVRVRMRPSRSSGPKCLNERIGELGGLDYAGADGASVSFNFDRVYPSNCTQAAVFGDLAFVVDAALSGYNGAVLAYGQTGAGKTHTLFGNVRDPVEQGVVPRSIAHLGKGIAGLANTQGAIFRVTVSIVEIYCERIRCLLSDASHPGKDNLQVKTDPVRGVYVEGAIEMEVSNEEELNTLMTQGLSGRSVAATNMNAESSRSHCVVTIRVEQSPPSGEARLGKLVLVDLAGSERAGKTGAQGATLAEGALINKSLSCLANVIYALTDTSGAPKHVPYRDSKLTRLLQDSLGSTARTVLICCCHPDADNAPETLSTLRFGARAKGLTCKLQVNQRLSAERLQQLLTEEKAATAALSSELAIAKAALKAAGLEMPTGMSSGQPANDSDQGALAPKTPDGKQPNSRSPYTDDCGPDAADMHDGMSGENASQLRPSKSTNACVRNKNRSVLLADVVAGAFMFISVTIYMAVEDKLMART